MNIDKKISSSIDLIRKCSQSHTYEVMVSGGKDSDVLLHLFKEAHVNFTCVHKSTTIDPPGTLSHVTSLGAVILRPAVPFLQKMKSRGWPTMWRRWCCQVYKEYYTSPYIATGVRKSESVRRAARYVEPLMCRLFPGKRHVEILAPLIDWTDADIESYILGNVIRCHPLYYNDGKFNVKRRLGCIGCPLTGDRGKADFLLYPKFFRLRCYSMLEYGIRHGMSESQVYSFILNQLFYSNHGRYKFECCQHGLFEPLDPKLTLSNYFNISL